MHGQQLLKSENAKISAKAQLAKDFCLIRGITVPELEHGKVLPGGADRQILRSDGVKELDALYEMEADNGDIITIRNQVLVDQNGLDERYAMSAIKVMAASTEFNWLNRRLIIGTLQSARPKLNAVIVRGWIADQK